MRFVVILTALALGACNNGGGDDDTGNGVAGLGDPRDETNGTDPDCEIWVDPRDGTECVGIEGATRWLAADIALNDDETISGYFYFVLHANEPWQETSDWTGSDAADAGKDWCNIAFQLSGTWNSDGIDGCGACAIGIDYQVSLDRSLTDCPAALVATDGDPLNGREGSWGVQQNGDGSAVGWDTQRDWAPNGAYDDKGVILWSDGGCAWYGSGECT